MRNIVTVARRLLETRRTVKGLERLATTEHGLHETDKARLFVFRAALQALAWVLEMDLDQIDQSPSLLGLPEQPTQPQLHRIEIGDPAGASGTRTLFLVEIPAYTDPRDDCYSMETWSCFLSDQHAYELYLALGASLYPEPTSPLEELAVVTLPRLQPAPRTPAQQPLDLPLMTTAPDVEEASSYIGQGVRHLHAPPQTTPRATPRGPRGPRGPRNPQRGA